MPKSVEKVIENFERLPGIGPKSASRMAYFFLRAPNERSIDLAKALVEMKKSTMTCNSCFNVSDSDPCKLCSDDSRDSSKICIVEEPLDVVALENSGVFKGKYFVLGGVISPADGIGPENLRVKELKDTIKKSSEEELEIIIATNPSLEGEATAAFILDMINGIDGKKIRVSRLAMGLPTGADLEYADRLTLKRAMEGRTKI
ncbi:MAG: recombination mediator RecR [bacterium]